MNGGARIYGDQGLPLCTEVAHMCRYAVSGKLLNTRPGTVTVEVGSVIPDEICGRLAGVDLTLDALFESGDTHEQQRPFDDVRVVAEFTPDQRVELVVH